MSEMTRNDIGGYYDTIIVESGGYTYVAEAAIGTPRATAAGRVKRIYENAGETQVTWANNHPGFVHSATDITSLTFRDI